jgi:hypothetical protein
VCPVDPHHHTGVGGRDVVDACLIEEETSEVVAARQARRVIARLISAGL